MIYVDLCKVVKAFLYPFLTLRGRLPRDGPLSTLPPTWFGVDKMVGTQISYWILKEAKTVRTYVIIACDTRGYRAEPGRTVPSYSLTTYCIQSYYSFLISLNQKTNV